MLGLKLPTHGGLVGAPGDFVVSLESSPFMSGAFSDTTGGDGRFMDESRRLSGDLALCRTRPQVWAGEDGISAPSVTSYVVRWRRNRCN